jgi:hypothetical protein
MSAINNNGPRDQAFLAEVEKVKRRIGERELDDRDLVVLACEEISRTYTREEKKYR